MKCPKCGGQIFENYTVQRTAEVIGVDAQGWPVTSDDADDTSIDTISFNCADCWAEWSGWPELYKEIEARTP